MEANTRHLERIFDKTIQYQVPLFQRPYVWTREANLEPLWEDILSLLDKHLRTAKVHPHFLGAVVLEQLGNSTGSIESRQVIDGQQRFTTLQIFMIAARDIAKAHGNQRHVERFGDMVSNRAFRIDNELEAFKVWPTNSDRPAFRAVHEAGSPQGLAVIAKANAGLGQGNIADAYRYFYGCLEQWILAQIDDDEDAAALASKGPGDRLDSLWQVVKGHLQLVVIDLDKDDETQVIFETLNARGEELLPADLIKNLLFRRAAADSANVEKLYEAHWQRLETPFWREQVVQGRLKRPRIDVFINHYLTLMTRDEVKSTHLFNAFKAFALDTDKTPGSLIPVPTTSTEHIAQLGRYSDVFAQLGRPGSHPRLATFIRRLEAVDTTTVYPFLIHAYAELVPDRTSEFDAVLTVIESFLMRRMICGLSPKNYNRLFVDLIRHVERREELSVESVVSFLARGTGESVRFPGDAEVTSALARLPLYGRLAQYKVRAVLEALDAFADHAKSERLPLPVGLEIEHILPRAWQTHWPLALGADAAGRDALVHSLGNLTLVTKSLNPALSNSPWSTKRPELLKFSQLNLNRYFHGAEAVAWDDAAIAARTAALSRQLLEIWPGA